MATSIEEIKEELSVPVSPVKEYVGGGEFYSYTERASVLPEVYDEAVNNFSFDVYEKMLHEPELAKCYNILKLGTLGDGVTLLPSIPETDDGYEEAVAVADFCNKALAHLNPKLSVVLEQMMDAILYGHKIAEVTYKYSEVFGFSGTFLVPDIIKVKKNKILNFVVDNKKNILGLVSYRLDKDAEEELSEDDAKVKITYDEKTERPYINGKPILPRDKFMVLTINSRDGDPRGNSLFRPALQHWHIKQQILPEYLRFLLLCAIPLLVGYTPENQETGTMRLKRDSQGNPIKDADGKFVEIDDVVELKEAMEFARNAEVLALRGGSKIQEVGANGAGTAFWKAIEIFDRQMEMAILNQTLATSEGIHQNRAASETQMSVLDQLIWGLKGMVINMIRTDLLRNIIRFNLGEDALVFMPEVSLGDTERRQFAVDATAIATLYKAGFLQPEQLKAMDAILNIPIRKTVDPLLLVQQLQAAGIPILAVPPEPESVAQVQAGTGGGVAPVQAAPSAGELPVDKSETSSVTSRNRSSTVRFPAVGRVKSKINRAPVNSELA